MIAKELVPWGRAKIFFRIQKMMSQHLPLYPVVLPLDLQSMSTKERVMAMHRFSREALTLSAGRTGISLPPLEKDGWGAPMVFGDGYYWSLSHKPSGCAAVVGQGRMGIDIEEIRTRGQGVMDYAVTKEEWALLGEQSWQNFFILWTAKEAVLKAEGIGLAGLSRCCLVRRLGADELALDFTGRPWLVSYKVLGGHVVALVKQEGQEIIWVMADGRRAGASGNLSSSS